MSDEQLAELVVKGEHVKKQCIGKRFLIVGDHPHAGKVAECIAFEKVAFGEIRPRMRSEGGDEFFVMKPQNWKMIQ